MLSSYRRRRLVVIAIAFMLTALFSFNFDQTETEVLGSENSSQVSNNLRPLAINTLNQLNVKAWASHAGYSRAQFGSGWATSNGCDTRNVILYRDLKNAKLDDSCHVLSGVLNDPYTGKLINFLRGSGTSSKIQIDHVVALNNAWITGAEQLSRDKRIELASDPLELLAVDGSANQQKSGSDVANWLPYYKPFCCQYVARQIAVKQKYKLWVTSSERSVIVQQLSVCPTQTIPN